jgi:hypothetical protein
MRCRPALGRFFAICWKEPPNQVACQYRAPTQSENASLVLNLTYSEHDKKRFLAFVSFRYILPVDMVPSLYENRGLSRFGEVASIALSFGIISKSPLLRFGAASLSEAIREIPIGRIAMRRSDGICHAKRLSLLAPGGLSEGRGFGS